MNMTTPIKVVNNILQIFKEKPEIYKQEIKYVEYLYNKLFYTAPEIQWQCVWVGFAKAKGLYTICSDNIKGERELDQRIFKAYHKYYLEFKQKHQPN
jgi:hypothetical protein